MKSVCFSLIVPSSYVQIFIGRQNRRFYLRFLDRVKSKRFVFHPKIRTNRCRYSLFSREMCVCACVWICSRLRARRNVLGLDIMTTQRSKKIIAYVTKPKRCGKSILARAPYMHRCNGRTQAANEFSCYNDDDDEE